MIALLSLQQLREIVKMVEESGIQKFEYETSRVIIAKNDGTEISVPVSASGPLYEPDKPRESHMAFAPSPADGVETAAAETAEKTITAPMLGTFYAAPEPGKEPFVQAGKQVTADTVVCVLEAMKLFNEIRAGVEGEIVKVLVEDGEFVEYGRPLFLVKTD
ncbi:acetyl-CoA carboxylase biotin carboxyl carrier protein [Paenibacillus humicola]|uniref:acetyl-CoA carboxylase biotin carboxyl carrier protein n=1 Tax=Paenibacillus humicola TaxID=3110540 RepID=UPI00237B94E7|nr:acetyl-CoA carboxylase biotin carboxyl carrier protein [Paenibacillus humicola]